MKRRLSFLVLLTLLASPGRTAEASSEVAPTPTAQEAEPGRDACDYGIAAAFHGDVALAESVFVLLLARSPGDSRALTNLGNLCLMRGEPDVAMAFYERAAAADTADAGIVLDQAMALLLLGEDEAASARAAAGTERAGGVREAARLLGLPTGPMEEAPKAAAKTRVSQEEILSLLRSAATAVPEDSLRAAQDSTRVPDTKTRDARARKVPVWRAAGARAGDEDVAATIYWKR